MPVLGLHPQQDGRSGGRDAGRGTAGAAAGRDGRRPPRLRCRRATDPRRGHRRLGRLGCRRAVREGRWAVPPGHCRDREARAGAGRRRGGHRPPRSRGRHRVGTRAPADPGSRGVRLLDQPGGDRGEGGAGLAGGARRWRDRSGAGAGVRPVRQRRHRRRGCGPGAAAGGTRGVCRRGGHAGRRRRRGAGRTAGDRGVPHERPDQRDARRRRDRHGHGVAGCGGTATLDRRARAGVLRPRRSGRRGRRTVPCGAGTVGGR